VRLRAVTLSDELVRAAIADRLGELVVPMRPQPVARRVGLQTLWLWGNTDEREWWTIACPLGAVGDELWGREAFGFGYRNGDKIVVYRADMSGGERLCYTWRSALQMRRADSRLRFAITALRCERIQHASADSARLRGFASVAEFRAWWDRSTSGSKPRAPRDGESWDENPWVFVASVRRVEAKI
jgi:hypothetical protein